MRAIEHPVTPEITAVLDHWEKYLRYERNLSPHTVAAYLETMREFFSHYRRFHGYNRNCGSWRRFPFPPSGNGWPR